MEQEKRSHLIQTAVIPSFYRSFHCLAQKCRDSCCMGWRINFDKNDYLRLRRLEAPAGLKEQLSKGVRRLRGKMADGKMYGHFDLDSNEGRCPFLDPEGLCAIQRACGHDALPDVCTSYPRRVTFSPAAKEYALSPSCEGVLQLLWDLPEGIGFLEEPLPKAEYRTLKNIPGENLLSFYAPIHRTMIDVLQNRALSLSQRMLYLGITIQRLQKEDWTGFDPERWRQQTLSLIDSDVMKETLGKITGNRMLYIMQNLKVLNVISRSEKKDWVREVYEALEVEQRVEMVPEEGGEADPTAHFLMDLSPENYDEALAEFESAFSGQGYFFENLMVAAALYLVFPTLTSREDLWKSYVSLCNLYSFYRFAAVLGCKGNAAKERLFHMIAMASRVTLHNRDRFRGFQEELFQHESSTLAHMAILLNG